MTLNAQERAAVEAAKAWSAQPSSETDVRIRSELISEWQLPPRAWILPSHAATYACGHLSGFRAGVEAAMALTPVNVAREVWNAEHALGARGKRWGERAHYEDGRPGYVEDAEKHLQAIRALLAQEDEHGS